MSSELKRTAVRTKPDAEGRRTKIWDNKHGRWVNLTEQELQKRWPLTDAKLAEEKDWLEKLGKRHASESD